MTTKEYKVRTKKEFDEMIRDFREEGFMLITLWKNIAELESDLGVYAVIILEGRGK